MDRVLSGMQSSGKVHLGNLVGALQNWVNLPGKYDCFYLSAVYTGHYGMDRHLSGDPKKVPISRGVPISKAMEPHSIIAFEMNGEPIPKYHGFPVRTVCPGWPGSTSHKWLNRIWVRDRVHDGPKMEGYSYRLPRDPVAPGTEPPAETS